MAKEKKDGGKNSRPPSVENVMPVGRIFETTNRDQFLSEAQVAQILNRAPSTLQKDRCNGRGLPYVRFGRTVRYCLGDLVDYIEANRVAY